MRQGKVKESVLRRSVLRQIHTHSLAGSPGYGEDAGLFPVEERETEQRGNTRLIAVSVNPVEGWTLAARRAVYGAVNSLAAADAVPAGIAPVIFLPEDTEERQLKALMREINVLCQQEKISCLAGHTTVSPFAGDLMMSVTALGYRRETAGSETDETAAAAYKKKKNSAPWQLAAIRPHMDIVTAGTAGREGTAMLAIRKKEELLTRYPSFFVEEAEHLFDDASMRKAADIARAAGAVGIHDVREGGIFGGLWELAAAGGVGLDVELKRIPVRQHTIEVCEFFRLNPYMLISGGTLLIVCENGERVAAALAKEGIPAAVIGQTTDRNDRIIRYDDEIRYLEPPKEDEYYTTVQPCVSKAELL